MASEESLPVNRHRRARLTIRRTVDKRSSLTRLYETVPLWKALRNGLLIMVTRHSPKLALKRFLYHAIGMKVGIDVSFAWEVTPDLFFPELISVGNNSIIGYNTTILAYEYLLQEWRVGPVQIGQDVTIGANCIIAIRLIMGWVFTQGCPLALSHSG